MATQTRRYASALDPSSLTKLVEPSAAVSGFSGAWIQISFDDSIAGIVEALDEFMLEQGYIWDDDAGKHLNLRSGDGTVWGLDVTNNGAVQVTGGVAPSGLLQWGGTGTNGGFLNAFNYGAVLASEDLQAQIIVPGDSAVRTIQNARAQIATAPGVGETLTFNLRVNGVASTLSIVIADANVVGSNTSDKIAVNPGDTLSWQLTKSGVSAGSPGIISLSTELF